MFKIVQNIHTTLKYFNYFYILILIRYVENYSDVKYFNFQNNNVHTDNLSRPASDALTNISVDENTLELHDVEQDDSLLDEIEINKYLVFKKPEEDGPDIRGGNPDALLIHATKANKHGILSIINLTSVAHNLKKEYR